ncbi:MAG: nucleotidyltransferase family protein [Pseudomonadota bacterium]
MSASRTADPAAPAPIPGLAAIVLAAGRSRRFGHDKRWVDCRGRPLLAHAVATAQAVCPRVLVVVDRPWPVLERWGEPEVVVCPGSANGLSASRGCALGRLVMGKSRPAGVLFFLGDMPDVPAVEARRVAERMLDSGRPVRPVHAGRPGHPVAFPGRLLEPLHATGGHDLRALFSREQGEVLASSRPGVCRDVDWPSDLRLAVGNG